MAGFITLLTSVLILKGADIGGVATPWKFIVIALLSLGVACAIAGLWAALRAEAPPAGDVSFRAAVDEHKSIAAYEQSINRDSARSLAQARRLVFAALALLLTGTVLWWVSPPAKSAATNLRVTWVQNGKTVSSCGEADAAPSGTLELKVAGADTLTAISFVDVRQVAVVTSC